jgi:hypothetical protein
MRTRLRRAWINQPSIFQPDNKLHGTNVLAEEYNDEYIDVYFLSGPVHSMRIARSSLANGWINQ